MLVALLLFAGPAAIYCAPAEPWPLSGMDLAPNGQLLIETSADVDYWAALSDEASLWDGSRVIPLVAERIDNGLDRVQVQLTPVEELPVGGEVTLHLSRIPAGSSAPVWHWHVVTPTNNLDIFHDQSPRIVSWSVQTHGCPFHATIGISVPDSLDVLDHRVRARATDERQNVQTHILEPEATASGMIVSLETAMPCWQTFEFLPGTSYVITMAVLDAAGSELALPGEVLWIGQSLDDVGHGPQPEYTTGPSVAAEFMSWLRSLVRSTSETTTR